MLKDVRLCLEEAQAAGVAVPGRGGRAREVLSAAMGRGLGDADFAAMLEVARGLAGRGVSVLHKTPHLQGGFGIPRIP